MELLGVLADTDVVGFEVAVGDAFVFEEFEEIEKVVAEALEKLAGEASILAEASGKGPVAGAPSMRKALRPLKVRRSLLGATMNLWRSVFRSSSSSLRRPLYSGLRATFRTSSSLSRATRSAAAVPPAPRRAVILRLPGRISPMGACSGSGQGPSFSGDVSSSSTASSWSRNAAAESVRRMVSGCVASRTSFSSLGLAPSRTAGSGRPWWRARIS